VIAASIRSYLDRELTMVTVEDGYELRYEDVVLATLGDPKLEAEVECVTRDGTWRFASLRGGSTEARAGSAVVARCRSNLFPGATITLPDETRLRLRPPVMGQAWRVRRGMRDTLLDMRSPEGPWLVTIDPDARDIYHLPLLTVFALHAVLVQTASLGGRDFVSLTPYGGA
jgi:hypothetical protein